MKCPYPECRKDYNDTWPKESEDWIDPNDFGNSRDERETKNRLFVETRKCRFCHQYFHDISVGCESFDEFGNAMNGLEPLVTYPVGKTKFEAKSIPKKVIDAFNEAERCRSVGSLTGTGGSLRKSVYTLCDELKVEGEDYKNKIENLPVKEGFRNLLKQIKWLGDNTTKPGDEKYDMDMLDVAIQILPILIDDIYIKDEKAQEATKLLAKARSVNKIEKRQTP